MPAWMSSGEDSVPRLQVATSHCVNEVLYEDIIKGEKELKREWGGLARDRHILQGHSPIGLGFHV